MNEFSATIYGVLDSKSNSRKIVHWGQRMGVIKSPGARAFVQAVNLQLKRRDQPLLHGRIQLVANCYYPDERRDLDVALLMDTLQRGTDKNPGACLIENDRQIRELHAVHYVDRLRPRVEFTLREVPQP